MPTAVDARDDEVQSFLKTLFRLQDDLKLYLCLLSEPYTERGSSVSRIEMTVRPQDHDRIPVLLEHLRKEGYLPIQCVPLAANDRRYVFTALHKNS
jgi:hypothetical protein